MGDRVAFPPTLVHDVQVHLRLYVAVQVVHALELHTTQFTLVWGLASVDSLVISKVVPGAKLFLAQFAGVAPGLVFRLNMTPQIGRRPRSVATFLTQEPLAKVQCAVCIQLTRIAETLVANVTGEVLLVAMTHQVKL